MNRIIASLTVAGILGVFFLIATLVRSSTPGWRTPDLPEPRVNNAALGGLTELPSSTRQRIVSAYRRLPLTFESNHGQFDPQIKFVARSSGYTVFLTATETVLSVHAPSRGDRGRTDTDLETAGKPFQHQVRMSLLGVQSGTVEGVDALPGASHYFTGKDQAKWISRVPHYSSVRYGDVYPGVDLIYYGNQQHIEHDFVVASGADPKQIRFAVTGADNIEVDDQGELVIGVAGGEVRLRKPMIYQGEGTTRKEITGGYALTNGNRVSFDLGAYDRTKPLVIDPVLVYSSYLGGTGSETLGSAIFVDDAGSIYLTGRTNSLDFPTLNGFQPQKGGQSTTSNAYVAKLSANGTNLVYATYLGGSNDGRSIAVDRLGNAYVLGRTNSAEFPTTANAWRQTFGGGPSDGWVTKLSPDGSTLLYSTFVGGSGTDNANFLMIDGQGNATIAGATNSTDFPTASAIQPQSGGGFDGFVTRLSSDGTPIYSTYVGGAAEDRANLIAGDSQGNAYVAGRTASVNFPTLNALQKTYGGGTFDAWLGKLSRDGKLVYSTYLGGSGADAGGQVAVDGSGNIYHTGTTNSPDFPTFHAFQAILGGGTCSSPPRPCYDAYATKISSDGSALLYSTYLGGSGEENEVDGWGTITVDTAGSAYVGGRTASIDFPTANALQQTYGGGPFDNFLSKLSPDGATLLYSTYLGGSGDEGVYDVRLGSDGAAYVAGVTGSRDFPTISAFQSSYGGGPGDYFVAKISEVLTSGVFYFAQAGGGGGFSTGIALTNPSSTQAASGTVSFFGSDGRPVNSLAGNAVVPFVIQPSRSVMIGTADSGPITSGYARVSSNASIFANANYTFSAGLTSLSVGPSTTGSVFMASIFRPGGVDQGIALANITGTWVRITLTLKDTSGSEVSSNLTLDAGEQRSRFLSELIPGIPSGFKGTLEIAASAPVPFVGAQPIALAATMVEFGNSQLKNVPLTVVR